MHCPRQSGIGFGLGPSWAVKVNGRKRHTLATHSCAHTHPHTHIHTRMLTGLLWPQASVAHSRCIDAIWAKNLPPYGNLRVAWRSVAAMGGGAQGRQAMIKSNTERIRSDVTQAVRAESTPCGMQKPSAAKLSMPQKNFSHNPPAPPLSAFPQALLSWVDRHTIYPNLFAMCVCVSVGVCVRRTCNQTRWLSGLV